MANDGELDLNSLNDDDLVQQMHDDLYDGLKEEIEKAVHILLGRGWAPYDVLTKALVGGMKVVGDDFRDGILFVPEVLLAANAMKAVAFAAELVTENILKDKRPPFTLGEIKYGTQYAFMSVDKARRELGYAPRDVGISITDAIRWFRQNGYAE